MLLRLVHCFNSLEDTHRTTIFLSRADEGLHILREARASIATARVEELTSDTGITPDPLTHHRDVRTDRFAEVRHLVHEADACSEHRIGSILSDFCRGDVHKEYTEVIEEDGLVQASHQFACSVAIDPDDNAIRTHKVLDSIPLFEELRIRSHIKGNGHTTLALCGLDGLAHLEIRPYGYGALGDDQTIVRHRFADGTCYGEDVTQIRRAVFIGGRADRTEDDLHMRQNFGN